MCHEEFTFHNSIWICWNLKHFFDCFCWIWVEFLTLQCFDLIFGKSHSFLTMLLSLQPRRLMRWRIQPTYQILWLHQLWWSWLRLQRVTRGDACPLPLTRIPLVQMEKTWSHRTGTLLSLCIGQGTLFLPPCIPEYTPMSGRSGI